MTNHDLAERIAEIRERAAEKYQNVSRFTELDERCPDCGCAVFAATRRDIDTLIAAYEQLEREAEQLKGRLLAVLQQQFDGVLTATEAIGKVQTLLGYKPKGSILLEGVTRIIASDPLAQHAGKEREE